MLHAKYQPNWPNGSGEEVVRLNGFYHICTGDNHVTCGQLSKPDVATLSYRRSHYWWEKER